MYTKIITDNKESRNVTYMEDTDEEVESDALSDDEEDSLFFSDEDDNISIYTEHKEKSGELGGMNKTAQLGVCWFLQSKINSADTI